MTFLPEFGADKSIEFVFHQTEGSPLIRWILNDSMYVGFGGMRNKRLGARHLNQTLFLGQSMSELSNFYIISALIT